MIEYIQRISFNLILFVVVNFHDTPDDTAMHSEFLYILLKTKGWCTHNAINNHQIYDNNQIFKSTMKTPSLFSIVYQIENKYFVFILRVCVRAYVYRIFIPFFGYKTTNIRAQSKSSDDGMQSLKWIIKGCLRRESIHSIQVKICQNELCWKMQQNCNDFQCDEIIADVVHLCNRIPYVLNRKRDKLIFFSLNIMNKT